MLRTETIEVQNVNHPSHVERVNREKYLAMREVLLRILPAHTPGLTQKEMTESATAEAPAALWPGGAKVAWWVKTVQLDLEAKGLVVRDNNAKPLRWRKA